MLATPAEPASPARVADTAPDEVWKEPTAPVKPVAEPVAANARLFTALVAWASAAVVLPDSTRAPPVTSEPTPGTARITRFEALTADVTAPDWIWLLASA